MRRVTLDSEAASATPAGGAHPSRGGAVTAYRDPSSPLQRFVLAVSDPRRDMLGLGVFAVIEFVWFVGLLLGLEQVGLRDPLAMMGGLVLGLFVGVCALLVIRKPRPRCVLEIRDDEVRITRLDGSPLGSTRAGSLVLQPGQCAYMGRYATVSRPCVVFSAPSLRLVVGGSEVVPDWPFPVPECERATTEVPSATFEQLRTCVPR